jgi:hypothetical protein
MMVMVVAAVMTKVIAIAWQLSYARKKKVGTTATAIVTSPNDNT